VKQKRIIIRGPQQVALVNEILSSGEMDGSVETLIRPYRKNRSYEQNSYYWKLITIISDELGNTKEELHETYKRKFLVRILARDDEDFYNLLQVVADGGDEEHRKTFAKLISTTGLAVKQFSEYTEDITKHAADLGIWIPQLGE